MQDDHSSPPNQPDRAAVAERATWISVAVNLVLTLAQIVVGWLAHSQSLIAHGLHSFSDLLSDFLVIWASRQSAAPADQAHPYGHGRVETASTLALGTSLTLIGGGILWDAGRRLEQGVEAPAIGLIALWIAIVTVIAKEGLYQYLIRVGRQLRSQLLIANALHTRADAASALVVVVGIGGALAGWSFLDLLAAALMGAMILRMGASLAWDAIKELIDTGLDETQVKAIRLTLEQTPGVLGLHELRTRRMAHQVLVDAHVQVDPRISVSEGHRIAESSRARVLREHPEVLDVLVHIDPEDDANPEPATLRLPGREKLMPLLTPLIADLPPTERIVLHYLDGKIEIDLFFDHRHFSQPAALCDAETRLAGRLEPHPEIRSIRLNCINAPKQ